MQFQFSCICLPANLCCSPYICVCTTYKAHQIISSVNFLLSFLKILYFILLNCKILIDEILMWCHLFEYIPLKWSFNYILFVIFLYLHVKWISECLKQIRKNLCNILSLFSFNRYAEACTKPLDQFLSFLKWENSVPSLLWTYWLSHVQQIVFVWNHFLLFIPAKGISGTSFSIISFVIYLAEAMLLFLKLEAKVFSHQCFEYFRCHFLTQSCQIN